MNISLSPELEKFVHDRVKSGKYNDASEVIAEALEVVRDEEGWDLEELRREISIGAEQLRRGEYAEYDAEAIKAEGRARLAAKKRG